MQRVIAAQIVPKQRQGVSYLGQLLQKIYYHGTTAIECDNEQYLVVGFCCYTFSLY